MFAPVNMLIANFSLLLSCLILYTCGQFCMIGGEQLISAITKLHAWIPPVCTGWAPNP